MKGKSKKARGLLVSLLTLAVAALFISPLYVLVVNAFKTPLETATNVLAPPASLHLENFSRAVEVTNFFVSLRNSVIVTAFSVAGIVLCSALSGYIISRNSRRRFYRFTEIFLLGGMMVPFQVVMIPVYRMLKDLGLMNTHLGAIVLMIGVSVPYATFLYVGFVKTIPRELEEAALIDGCSLFGTFWRIIFPLLKPITATVTALHMLWMWNEFNIALIVLQKKEVRTIPIQQFYFFGQHISNMNAAFAAACLSLIPVVIFFLIAQRYIQGGLTAGAVKG